MFDSFYLSNYTLPVDESLFNMYFNILLIYLMTFVGIVCLSHNIIGITHLFYGICTFSNLFFLLNNVKYVYNNYFNYNYFTKSKSEFSLS